MPQYIQLQQILIDGVVIKMGGDDIRIHIIGRVLYRREGVDILSDGEHDDTAGVLSCGTADTGTSFHDPVHLTVPFMDTVLLIIFFHIAKSRLGRQRTDGPGTEGLACAKDNLRIFMRLALVIAGKVQVDIRLLVAFKAQERFERNVKPFLFQGRAADGTVFIRHVTAGFSGVGFHLVGVEIIVMTFLAIIMRRQGIHLRDTGHGGHEGRTYRSPGAHQIAVLIGLPHQFLGDDIHHRVAVGDNGVQFPFQTLLNDFWQRFSVNLMSPVVADFPQRFIGILDHRRKFSFADRRNLLAHGRDLRRIFNHHFFRFFCSQIFELSQHLLRGPKKQRRLLIRVGKSLSRHDNAAVNFILGIHEMDVAGSRHWFLKLFAQPHNFSVQFF